MSLAQTHDGADKCQVPKEWCGPTMIGNLWYIYTWVCASAFQIFMLVRVPPHVCDCLGISDCLCMWASSVTVSESVCLMDVSALCNCVAVRYLLWLSC